MLVNAAARDLFGRGEDLADGELALGGHWSGEDDTHPSVRVADALRHPRDGDELVREQLCTAPTPWRSKRPNLSTSDGQS